MGVRVAVLTAIAAVLNVHAQGPPPPLFSHSYVEALNGTLDLEPIDVARLEQSLASNPDDFAARLRLMAYQRRSDRAGVQEDRTKVIRHTLWLIEHHPDSEILHLRPLAIRSCTKSIDHC